MVIEKIIVHSMNDFPIPQYLPKTIQPKTLRMVARRAMEKSDYRVCDTIGEIIAMLQFYYEWEIEICSHL